MSEFYDSEGLGEIYNEIDEQHIDDQIDNSIETDQITFSVTYGSIRNGIYAICEILEMNFINEIVNNLCHSRDYELHDSPGYDVMLLSLTEATKKRRVQK